MLVLKTHMGDIAIENEAIKGESGNIGTIISFRVGTEDTMPMAKEMYPEFDVEDFINLPNYKIYLKLMINGKLSRPFRASTIHNNK